MVSPNPTLTYSKKFWHQFQALFSSTLCFGSGFGLRVCWGYNCLHTHTHTLQTPVHSRKGA